MRTLLIDGDSLCWNIAYNPDRTGYRACQRVRNWMRNLDADRCVVAFSCITGRYFRHDLYPKYKPHRSAQPEGFAEAADAIADAFTAKRLPGLEADDVLGILATSATIGGERIIVGIDKDLLSIPGLHFNWQKEPRQGVMSIGRRDADFNHLWQTLTGDSGDGYAGCPGIGPVKAKRILWGEPSQWWGQVVMAYKNAGLTESDALLQARLARIVRSEDYDLHDKSVIQWTPRFLLAEVAA